MYHLFQFCIISKNSVILKAQEMKLIQKQQLQFLKTASIAFDFLKIK